MSGVGDSPISRGAMLGRVNRQGFRRFDIWRIGAWLCALLVLLPVASVVWLALFPSENIWPHLLATSLPRYLENTLLLMLGVGVLTFVIGVGCAYLTCRFIFPGRAAFAWLLLLPFALPTYVAAYAYTDLLEFAGPVQSTLRQWFGWRLVGDYWFPEVRSLGGAIVFMGLVLYPYVYMLARAAFLQESDEMRDISRLLGRGNWHAFLHVSLPIARPGIAVGVSLALMETLNEFGGVDFFAVQTLSVGLYDVWLNMDNLGGAAQIASVTLAFVAVLLSLEYAARRRRRFYQAPRARRQTRVALHGAAKYAAFAACALPVLAGFVIPCAVLAKHALAHFSASWSPTFVGYIVNSLRVSASAAALCVILAVTVAYARRLYPQRGMRFAARAAGLGYALPGAVLAIGILTPFAAFDNTLDAFARRAFGVSTGLLLSGGVAAVVFAYVVRFLAVSIGSIEASFSKISTSTDMAARTLGHSAARTLRLFHLPLIRGGALTAALIVFVDCMKELPATLILRPFNFETLATHVYHFASDEMIEQSALGALLIVACGLLPVIVLSRSISASQQLAHRPA